MLSAKQIEELKRVYGALGGVEVASIFNELDRYMVDSEASFEELVSCREYKKGLSQERFERLVRKADVPSYLRDYKERIEANLELGLAVSVGLGDIRVVLQREVSALMRHSIKSVVGSAGKRVYTGQTEQQGSRVGMN